MYEPTFPFKLGPASGAQVELKYSTRYIEANPKKGKNYFTT